VTATIEAVIGQNITLAYQGCSVLLYSDVIQDIVDVQAIFE